MTHFTISGDGSYTLSDLKQKLEEITDWEWDEKADDTAEWKDGEVKFHEAVHVYEALKVSILGSNPRLADKGELRKLADLWDKYSTNKYKVPRVGFEHKPS
mgnify:CR=1 FL=1|jgi:hypothetical protein